MNTYFNLFIILCLIALPLGHAMAQHTSAPAPTVPVIQPKELAKIEKDQNIVILDTRSEKEYQESHLEHARLVNYDSFKLDDVDDLSKDQKIVVYCLGGHRSNMVAKQLIDAGYKRIKSLDGGITHWKEEGLPVVEQQENE